MTADSFMRLKISMFVCVNPASSGLVSEAPKKTMPMRVVSQSAVPTRMIVVQNRIALLTTLLCLFLHYVGSDLVIYSQC